MVLDALAGSSNIFFESARLADRCSFRSRGRTFVLIKPSTFVNLSGRSVHYWLKKEKIPIENLLVVTDDIALPFGTLRLRPRGGSGGHNGLDNINLVLGTQAYARLRFGIGNNFHTGRQVEYVLGSWTEEEAVELNLRIETACEIIRSFGNTGLEFTMNNYNNR